MDIEEDIKIIENYLKDSSYKEKDNSFFKGSGWEVVDLEIPKAMANVLIEFKKKAERIKELEEENHLQRKQIMSAYDKGWIPKQKVKEILKELNQEYIKIDKSIDIHKKSGDRGKVDCLQMIGWLEGKLEELLEDK